MARISSFDQALADTLRLVASSMRSGLSFDQALSSAVSLASADVRADLQGALTAILAGQPRGEVFTSLARRRPSESLHFLATAVTMNDAAGGNVAPVLESIADDIRSRTHLHRELQTATAQARLSSYVLGVLPLLLLIVVNVLVPDYYQSVWHSKAGLMVLAAGIVLCAVGFGCLQLILRSAAGTGSDPKSQLLSDLPNAVGLLVVGLESGWSFDQSVAYLIGNVRGPSMAAFDLAYRSIAAGVERDQALRRLSAQSKVAELSRLVNAVLTTGQSGGSLIPMLRMQAEDLRRELRQRRERRIRQAPAKMTVVTALLIFPALFCTLLAPAVASVAH